MSNPTDRELIAAQVIALFDRHHANWYVTLLNDLRNCVFPKEVVLIEIPVDSSNPNVVESWKQRLATARCTSRTNR